MDLSKIIETGVENLETAKRILESSEFELRSKGFTDEEVKTVCYLASDFVFQNSNIESSNSEQYLSTGCGNIDDILGGGLKCGSGIYEVAGESSCGKTQLCLQLSIVAQNSRKVGGLNKKVLYINTESNPLRRLKQMVENVREPLDKDLPYEKNIFFKQANTLDELKSILFEELPTVLVTKGNNIGLVILDSVAGLLRIEENGEMRTKNLRKIGCQLQRLCTRYNLCVFCVNQVAAVVSGDKSNNAMAPCLGLAWSNLISTRLTMTRGKERIDEREIKISFSPDMPPAAAKFIVTSSGVQSSP